VIGGELGAWRAAFCAFLAAVIGGGGEVREWQEHDLSFNGKETALQSRPSFTKWCDCEKSRQMLSSVLMAKKLHCIPDHHSPLAIGKLKNTGSTIIEPQRPLSSS
jgi:hypothetical protein